ncbi:MAG: ABC-F family ATP-binding cassette domain-containing protein [Chloroflexi bacterium]|nr:MAG: ABC-F family ATP-binding cassette domain-containing protein [Chloroflexota bacterium]TMD74323.1 MAG: ABC-F family ATP-binding cassette domain-containing protein [Chloroflexota bacterium]
MIQARDLAIDVAARRVLSDASFTVAAGDKVGLVGRNGAGKTSLLKVLAAEDDAAGGLVLRRGTLGYVPQNPRPRAEAAHTALSHILSGRGLDQAAARLSELHQVLEHDHSIASIEKYSEAEERYRLDGGYSSESEARRIASGLGLRLDRVDLPLSVLSGGERRRVELARVLFADADLLLLDEPTNHLDSDAKTWLMDFLREYRGAVIVVSHDLALLDASITRVLHLDSGRLIEYRGTYSQYQAARRLEEKRLTSLAQRQQAEIQRLSLLAEVMRRQTQKRAKQAHSIFTRVERMKAQRVTAPRRERKVKISFPDPPHSGRIVLHSNGLAKGYGGPLVFRDVSFEVERHERLLVMGLNGAGKTSLLRILAGQSEPNAGSFRLGHGVSLGYYAQEHEGIRPGVPVLAHMREQSDAEERVLRALLGMFGLTGDIARQDAGTLSGGEKTKLALAQLVAGRHNLLLLDEPTNNLDPPSRSGVARALSEWPGTMLIVSHDPEFVEALQPGRVMFMPEGRLDYWDEDLLDVVSMA